MDFFGPPAPVSSGAGSLVPSTSGSPDVVDALVVVPPPLGSARETPGGAEVGSANSFVDLYCPLSLALPPLSAPDIVPLNGHSSSPIVSSTLVNISEESILEPSEFIACTKA